MALKAAVTDLAASMARVHPPVPVQPPPDQPAKLEPGLADAERVTTVPLVKLAWHVALPAGQVPLEAP